MKNKVLVPNAEKLRKLYPSKVMARVIHKGDLKTLILVNLYIQGLLKNDKVLLSSLGKGYVRKDIFKIYEMIMENINGQKDT